MRPSAETIELLKYNGPVYEFVEDVIKDFEEQAKGMQAAQDNVPDGASQMIVDAMFVWYCAGITSQLSGGTRFSLSMIRKSIKEITEEPLVLAT